MPSPGTSQSFVAESSRAVCARRKSTCLWCATLACARMVGCVVGYRFGAGADIGEYSARLSIASFPLSPFPFTALPLPFPCSTSVHHTPRAHPLFRRRFRELHRRGGFVGILHTRPRSGSVGLWGARPLVVFFIQPYVHARKHWFWSLRIECDDPF